MQLLLGPWSLWQANPQQRLLVVGRKSRPKLSRTEVDQSRFSDNVQERQLRQLDVSDGQPSLPTLFCKTFAPSTIRSI